MRSYILVLFFQFTYSLLIAQFHYCDKLETGLNYYPFSKDKIKCTKDFISNKYPNQISFYSDRSKLKKLNIWSHTDSIILIISDQNKIEINFGVKPVFPEKYFYPKEENEKYSRIIDEQSAPYGLNSEDSIANCINRLLVNNINCPNEAINDLLNINWFYTFLSIKTPEAYISKNEKYIYLYLFGELKMPLMELHDAINMSYMAKLVFDSKGNYLDRIVERGSTLSYFGFGDCPYFIGF